MSTEVEEFLEALFDEEEYVNVEPALRALVRLDKRISKAVEHLKNNKIGEAINLMKKAGLEEDQIIFIISTVLKKTLEDAENIYNAHTERTRDMRIRSPSTVSQMSTHQIVMPPVPKQIFFTSINMRQYTLIKGHEFIPKISWNGTAAG